MLYFVRTNARTANILLTIMSLPLALAFPCTQRLIQELTDFLNVDDITIESNKKQATPSAVVLSWQESHISNMTYKLS